MTSQEQIDANRANAKKSTGPNTPAGRATSRLNAIRDNVTGQIVTLSDEDRAIFEKHKADHVADLAPQGISEPKLAHAIAWNTWRLDRLRATEMNIYAIEADQSAAEDQTTDPALLAAKPDAHAFRDEAPRFELMSLYEQRMTRGLHRNRAALRELQQERRRRKFERDRREEILLAGFEDLKDLPYKAPATPSPNGFVFSTEDISGAAERQRNLEASSYLLNSQAPWVKYAATGAGSPDLFAQLPFRPLPSPIPPKIHGVSPESIEIRKLHHPEHSEVGGLSNFPASLQ